MGTSCLRFAVAIAFCVASAAMPCAVAAQAQGEAPPSDAKFKEQIKRLKESDTLTGKLDVLKWVERHSGAKNAHLAIPALEQCIRKDPQANVRAEAVACLALIVKERHEPCPLLIVETILDRDVYVSQAADLSAGHFKSFAPGCVEVLLHCAKSENIRIRQVCVSLLAQAGGKDKKVLAAIERATHDKSFGVRHNAHCALFQATDNLEMFLTYLIRLQEDPDGVLGPVDLKTEAGKREQTARNLVLIGSAWKIIEWSQERADDLAPALLKLLASPSSKMRRGAARLVGASATVLDIKNPPVWTEKNPDWKKLLEPPSTIDKSDTRPQKTKVAILLEKLKVADRLRELHKNDPVPTVRNAARFALERLARAQEKKGSEKDP